MKAIKITTDNVISVIDIQEPTLKGMQEHVGGHIETVRGYDLNNLDAPGAHDLLIIVNEEGKRKELPYNIITTDLVDFGDFIVGDALIMAEGFVDGEPDIVGLTDEQAQALMEHFEYNYDLEETK